jgi:hypothetical protein
MATFPPAQERRVCIYGGVHHDYHAWDADEDRRYREFMEEHRLKYRECARLSQKDQLQSADGLVYVSVDDCSPESIKCSITTSAGSPS